jgi:poly-gamma-glutamate capsule biosynthesis protein CapA/YwtB (metallophosphatase superfamily)
MRTIIHTILLIFLLALAACQLQQPSPVGYDVRLVEIESRPTTETIPPTKTAVLPTKIPTATLPSATAVPTSAPTATAVPTDAPAPTISLFIPPEWQDIAPQAIAQLNGAQPEYNWQLAANLETADIRLSQEEGVMVHQEPLALVVPYNASWDYTDQATAQGVIDFGHQLAQVMPWRHIERTQKALRIDGRFPTDADYPFHEDWYLVGVNGTETPALSVAEVAVSAAAPIFRELMVDTVVHMAAVGDIMLDRTLGSVIEEGGIEFPFKLVAEPLQSADITVGNLESALGSVGEPVEKSFTFQSPPAAAESLAWGGFDVISLANNHAMDYGPDSLLQGIDLLKAQNVAPIGAGANATEARTPHIVQVNGLSVAFLGYVHVPVEARGNYFDTATWTATETDPGLAWAVPEEIVEDVTAVQSQADLVVVVLHSGYEYVEPPSEEQAAAAHAAIDAGADIVVGHHAHILQAVEFYKEGVIAYGLGNFAFTIDGDANTAILNVWLDADGVRQFEFIPAIVQYGGQPRLADAAESTQILSQVYRLSQGFPMPVTR